MTPRTMAAFAALAVIVTAIAALGATTLVSTDTPAPLVAAQSSVPRPSQSAWTTEWRGYARVGAADMLAHTKETEPVVAPLAKMGFDADVPKGTTSLKLLLEWPAGTTMHLMTHGPKDAGMPTYMGGMDATGRMCIRVPDAKVVPGVWKVMAHVDETAVNLDFTIKVETAGPSAARVLDELHGHPMSEKMQMSMEKPESC